MWYTMVIHDAVFKKMSLKLKLNSKKYNMFKMFVIPMTIC